MKKVFFIILLCVFCILISITTFDNHKEKKDYASCNNNLKSSQNENITTLYKTYMQYYFANLTKNFGTNSKGSCGYVALSSVLSYYDNFLSDDIIDEKYDVNTSQSSNDFMHYSSPGVKADSSMTNLSNSEYKDYIAQTKDSSFHSYLIYKGIKYGYYELDKTSPCGTTSSNRKTILTSYLKERGISYDFEYTSDMYTKAREYAIEYIKKGFPVLLSIENKTSSHTVVAYDYDEVNDQIYCHFGWNSSTTHVTPESQGYTKYNVAEPIVLENINHKHSNNYIASNLAYCYCSHDIYTYTTNVHNYTVYSYDASYHKYLCQCGSYYLEEHSKHIYTLKNNNVVACMKCDFGINLNKGPYTINLGEE